MKVRNVEEIQRAHDLLVGIIIGEVPWPMKNPSERQALTAVAACLCWVLEHDHNALFPKWMGEIQKKLEDMGYKLTDQGN